MAELRADEKQAIKAREFGTDIKPLWDTIDLLRDRLLELRAEIERLKERLQKVIDYQPCKQKEHCVACLYEMRAMAGGDDIPQTGAIVMLEAENERLKTECHCPHCLRHSKGKGYHDVDEFYKEAEDAE